MLGEISRLERIFQPEFYLSPAVDRNSRIVEMRVEHIVRGRKQIGVIERIEQLGPEFEHLIFQLPDVDGKIALYGGIKVNLPRPEE
jgi:hypothetical protein